jgi:hypothetical protein
MFRLFATFVLLIPLSLNGLRIVCAEPEDVEAAAAAAAAAEHCKQICPAHKSARVVESTRPAEESRGPVCKLAAGEEGCPVAGLLFAVSSPVRVADHYANCAAREAVDNPAARCLSPTLGNLSPPPKA